MAPGTSLLCGLCNKNVPKTEYRIPCDTCKKYFHQKCANLSESDIKTLQIQRKSWICEACNPDKNSRVMSQISSPAISKNNKHNQGTNECNSISSEGSNILEGSNEIKQLILELKTELNDLKKSVEFMSNKFDEENENNKAILDMLEECKKENILLKSELQMVKNTLNDYEKEKKENNLVISGIDIGKQDNASTITKKCLQVLKYVDNSVDEQCIKTVKKIGNEMSKVIITFHRNDIKSRIMENKKKRGQFSQKDCKVGNQNVKVYINEDLTQYTYKLLQESKKLRTIGYSFIWCKYGNVYARKAEGQPHVRIKDSLHIDSLIQMG